MKRSVFVAPLAVSLFLFAACRDQQPLQPKAPAGPAALIMDGAHGGPNGNFFFLPSLVSDPSGSPNFRAGAFNAKLSPVVEVCQLHDDPRLVQTTVCVGGLVFGPATMPLDGEQYHLNWDTKTSPLLDDQFYRMTVRGAPGGTALGFLDLDPVAGGMKNVKTGDVVPFQDGRTLPIKVRIQDGAFGATNPDHVELVVPNHITTPTGTLDVTTNTGFAGAQFSENWLPAGINQVVVMIERFPIFPGAEGETCLTKPSDESVLLEREGCYRFRTDPDLHDFGPQHADLPFNKPVIAGVCFETPELVGRADGPPFELHRRVERNGQLTGETIDLAEKLAPFLTCAGFSRTQLGRAMSSGRLLDVASAAWHAVVQGVGRLVTPGALHAVDLGAGGSTDGFSRIGWAARATMTIKEGTNGNTAPINTRVSPDPTVCLTVTHHDASRPLGNAPVTFTVTSGAGTVGRGSSVTVNTEPTGPNQGCASAAWVLAAAPGANELSVTARATGSPQTFTATAFEAGAIDFESYPNGSATCADCSVTDQFAAKGVVFTFAPVLSDGPSSVSLLQTTNNPTNASTHVIVAPRLSEPSGHYSGVLTMTFLGAPGTIRYTSAGNDPTNPTQISARDAMGYPIPPEQITRTGGVNYQCDGCIVSYRQETVTITSLTGVSTVSIDMRSHLSSLDNLLIQQAPSNVIDFEALPDGTPICPQGCDVTNQFASRGVTFSFRADLNDNGQPLTPKTNASICDGSRIDAPEYGSRNHLVTGPMGYPCGGGSAGTLQMTFSTAPTTVIFMWRQPAGCSIVGPLPVGADGGDPFVSVGGVLTYTSGNGFAAEQVRALVTHPGGIASLQVFIRGCDAYMDNLLITP